MRQGDCYLICTDGLTGELTNEEIASLLARNTDSCLTTVNSLIQSALAHGGRDNVTLILLRVH